VDIDAIAIVPESKLDPTNCILDGPGIVGGYADAIIKFQIQTRDQKSKPLLRGGDKIFVELTGPEPIKANVADSEDGTYAVWYTTGYFGNYNMYITYNNQIMPALPVVIKPLSSICGGCGKTIIENPIKALQKLWHPDCFVCSSCNKVLVEYHFKSNEPYCYDCYNPKEKVIPTLMCAMCNKLLDPGTPITKALSKPYHQSCFKCSICDQIIRGEFGQIDGQLYCKNDLQRINNCSSCNQLLGSAYISVQGKKYHPQCFICVTCKKNITGSYGVKNGNNYCKDCLKIPA